MFFFRFGEQMGRMGVVSPLCWIWYALFNRASVGHELRIAYVGHYGQSCPEG
jgi:hypothetical protein